MDSFKSVLIAAVGAASLGFAVAASAGTSEQEPQLVVHYSAASLSTESGVRHLYGQLVTAAEKVCAQPIGRFPSEAIVDCRKEAVAKAVAQVHNSRLAELSARHSKIA